MEATSLDAERAVIGLVLHDQRTLADLDTLRPGHFHGLQTRPMWKLITSMAAKGEPITAHTVRANLNLIPVEERTGIDGVWLIDSMGVAPVSVMAEAYARQIINAADLRALTDAVIRSRQVVDGATDASEAIELVRSLVDAITPQTVAGSMLADHLYSSIARFDEPNVAIPTPWTDLNRIIGGWRPGGLYVVGARPGAGKSIFAIQAALHLAQQGPVAFNTLEMSTHEVNQRVVAHAASVWLSHLQGTGDPMNVLNENDRALIGQAAPELADLPLSIRDDRSVTVLGIRAHARSLSRHGQLAGIVVDYLQLLRSDSQDRRPRHEIVAEYSRGLKNLAGEMNCPVIALSQLNRAATGGAASLANLRESGALEQDADVVVLLSLPEDKDEHGNVTVDERRINIEVAKNRHGPPGRFTAARFGGKSTIGTRGELT